MQLTSFYVPRHNVFRKTKKVAFVKQMSLCFRIEVFRYMYHEPELLHHPNRNCKPRYRTTHCHSLKPHSVQNHRLFRPYHPTTRECSWNLGTDLSPHQYHQSFEMSEFVSWLKYQRHELHYPCPSQSIRFWTNRQKLCPPPLHHLVHWYKSISPATEALPSFFQLVKKLANYSLLGRCGISAVWSFLTFSSTVATFQVTSSPSTKTRQISFPAMCAPRWVSLIRATSIYFILICYAFYNLSNIACRLIRLKTFTSSKTSGFDEG